MDGLVMAGQLLLGLSILIILHELGHFLAARAFGIKVEKFYLFFDAWGFKLVHFKYKGCEYGIGWLPLGGYVKIAGMIDESMDTEQMASPPKPWEFRSKPAWQRLIVMLGGIAVNVVLAIFIFWMLAFKNGETHIPNDKLVNGIVPGKIGKEMGLMLGDRITGLNGKPVKYFDELISSKVLLGNPELTIVRGSEIKYVRVPDNALAEVIDHGIAEFVQIRWPVSIAQVVAGSNAEKAGIKVGDIIFSANDKSVESSNELVSEIRTNKNSTVALGILRQSDTLKINVPVTTAGTIGIASVHKDLPAESIHYGLVQSFPIGATRAWNSLSDNVKGLGKVASGHIKADRAFAGPIGIATLFGKTVIWSKFWSLVGLLSMALALMNLLPIPALDGGHAMFLLIEMVKGKPLSDKFMERAQMVGFVILITLMVFIYGNDIVKHVLN